MIKNYTKILKSYAKKIKKKIALITGSSKGIGLSIAKELDRSGVKVLTNSRNLLKRYFFKEFINSPDHFRFDVTSTKQTEQALKKIKKNMED